MEEMRQMLVKRLASLSVEHYHTLKEEVLQRRCEELRELSNQELLDELVEVVYNQGQMSMDSYY